MFNLVLLKASTAKHNAANADSQTLVQIKLTEGKRSIALRAEPQHLLVLRLALDLSVEEVYNGRGDALWAAAGKMQKNGQRAIHGKLRDSERLPLRNEVDLQR